VRFAKGGTVCRYGARAFGGRRRAASGTQAWRGGSCPKIRLMKIAARKIKPAAASLRIRRRPSKKHVWIGPLTARKWSKID
jgi:hypothetical protein